MKYKLSFILIILTLISCRKLVQDEFPQFENIPTLNGVLTQDSIIRIHLSLTDELNDNELKIIDNADIRIVINDTIQETLAYTSKGIYESVYKCNVDDKIKIYVISDYKDSLFSKTIIPKKSALLNYKLIKNAWVDDEGISQPAIQFEIPNSLTETLFYEAKIINAIGVNKFLFSNIDESGTTIIKNISFSSDDEPEYYLEVRSISKSYFDYQTSVELYFKGRYPEFGAGAIIPYNLYSNIESGYGIFCSYNSIISNPINYK